MTLRRLIGAWPTVLVIIYTLLGWPAGIWLLAEHTLLLNIAGVLLTTHTLICSAYLIHDCAHHAVFAGARGNDRLGALMGWINGACLADYARLKKKHLRHHSDRLDVVTFDYRAAVNGSPRWFRQTILALEWLYVPTVEIMMRGMIVAVPFSSGTLREQIRVTAFLAIRLACLGALAWYAPRAIFLYAVCYLIFLTVLRFLDAYQHTYEVFASHSLQAAPADPKRDLRYEYENTYSNLIAERWWWMNLLVLNFPYHNAHHVRPTVPWYKLPKLHTTLYGAKDAQVITCRELLASFHRHRVTRVMSHGCGHVAAQGNRADAFLGAVGVSFLTAV